MGTAPLCAGREGLGKVRRRGYQAGQTDHLAEEGEQHLEGRLQRHRCRRRERRPPLGPGPTPWRMSTVVGHSRAGRQPDPLTGLSFPMACYGNRSAHLGMVTPRQSAVPGPANSSS